MSKGTALVDYCQVAGIDVQRTITFGDNENDLSMIVAAGTGVAMGNAVESVKAAADVITATNDEDGIAQVLEPLLS